MSGENPKPDVVVVGMPSCGKTVFFTVLGKKFTNLVDGRRVAPLGFRMRTCDKATFTVVNVAYDRLRRGSWPEATKAGQMMPLRWEVFTGNRRIFELFSMDVAGETFKKAFDIGEEGGAGESPSRDYRSTKVERATSDSGDELYREGDVSAESKPQSVAETDEDRAAEELKMAIDTAKVVCFMVNIALPNGRSGRAVDDADEKKLLRFRSSVLNMYLSLKKRPELRAKSMIVLTQTHLHEGEIERAGGPVMYLGDVCGGEASELCNIVTENDIPVVAVSAINEERDSNELPLITSPDDIPSSGLFGFLLSVAGMVARDDSLAVVRNAYIAYQRERAEYLKYPSQNVMPRLAQAERYQEASAAFVGACEDYLDEVGNLVERGKAPFLSPSALAMYKRCTKENPEVKVATESEYLIRDQLWDRALRRAVALERQDSETQGPAIAYDEVLAGLLKEFPGRNGSEEFIYGFGEDDLSIGGEASTYEKWIELNLSEYRKELDEDIADLNKCKSETIGIIDSLSSLVGKSDFVQRLGEVKSQYDLFKDRVSAFLADWPEDRSVALHEVHEIEKEVDEKYSRIPDYKRDHFQHEEDHKRKLQRLKEEEELRQARSRRRKVMSILLLFLAMSASMLLGARYYHDKRNEDIAQKIGGAISRSEYAKAKGLYDSLVSIQWLGVGNTDHLCPDFGERLALATKNHEIRESAGKYSSRLEVLRKWLAEVDASSKEVNDARNECDSVLNSYKTLPTSVSFNDILQQSVDIKPMILVAQACESSLKSSIDRIEKMQKDRKEHLRKAAFIGEMQEAKRQLMEIDSIVDNLNMATISNSTETVNGCIGKLQELAGLDDEDAKNIEKFRTSADEILGRLKARHAEQRNQMFGKMLADIRLAIASNSVSQVWDKYDVAREFSASEVEREKLEKLHEEVLGFTVKACERALSEVEKNANMLRAESAISEKLLEGTRKSLELIEKVRNGLLLRIPETCNDFRRIESLAKTVQAKLPVIVQIDGVRQSDSHPVSIKNAGRATATSLNSTSSETKKQCVYFLVPQKELSSAISRLVRIADENGKTYGMSIRLFDLAPGINRFEKTIN